LQLSWSVCCGTRDPYVFESETAGIPPAMRTPIEFEAVIGTEIDSRFQIDSEVAISTQVLSVLPGKVANAQHVLGKEESVADCVRRTQSKLSCNCGVA